MKCVVCERNQADLGPPSQARWAGPDGEAYCSIHFTGKFGFGQPLVKLENYEPPKAVKPAAPKKKSTRKKKETADA